MRNWRSLTSSFALTLLVASGVFAQQLEPALDPHVVGSVDRRYPGFTETLQSRDSAATCEARRHSFGKSQPVAVGLVAAGVGAEEPRPSDDGVLADEPVTPFNVCDHESHRLHPTLHDSGPSLEVRRIASTGSAAAAKCGRRTRHAHSNQEARPNVILGGPMLR
jgi:hypothetical protein